MKNLKRIICIIICVSVMMTMLIGANAAEVKQNQIKNFILMVPDGMSVTETTIARWYNGGKPLAMDEMASGLIRTYSSDAAIADSAPAGTAMATGFKSHTGYVGVLPDVANTYGQKPISENDKQKPVANILEGAKWLKKSTGVVVTCEIPHATPSDFMAHFPSRHNYDVLSEQEVYSGVDVVFGGGSDVLTPGTGANNRKDGEDLVKVLKDKGYQYITKKSEMANLKSGKVWGMFAPMAMNYDMDRDANVQPSLSEMTKKAIDLLSQNPKGFFLMVEGSKIDWAAHANDPIGVVSDVLAFDNAVKVALDYAKSRNDTAVIVAADHGTGGMTMGNSSTNSGYDKTPVSTFIDPLKKAGLTGEGLESKFNKDRTNIKEVIAQYFGITDLTNDEIKAITEAKAGSMNYTVGPIISKRSAIGWTTTGHTGEEVVLYSYLPGNQRITGVLDNTDIAKIIAQKMGFILPNLSAKLFVPAKAAFEAKGAEVELDQTDKANPVIVVTKGSDTLKMPVDKNIAIYNGKPLELYGLVLNNGKTLYVPQQAVDLIK